MTKYPFPFIFVSLLTNIYEFKLFSKFRCGKEFYCPIGNRGPCKPNEVLIESNVNSTTKSNLSCSVLSTYPWTGCIPSKQAGKLKSSSPMGKCVLKSPEDPCSGYPTNFRYHPLKQTCQPISLITGYGF